MDEENVSSKRSIVPLFNHTYTKYILNYSYWGKKKEYFLFIAFKKWIHSKQETLPLVSRLACLFTAIFLLHALCLALDKCKINGDRPKNEEDINILNLTKEENTFLTLYMMLWICLFIIFLYFCSSFSFSIIIFFVFRFVWMRQQVGGSIQWDSFQFFLCYLYNEICFFLFDTCKIDGFCIRNRPLKSS